MVCLHSWACIDLTVFIDDDGQAWLFRGNRECYFAKMEENMIEIDGEIKQMKFDGLKFTEAPWMHYSINFKKKMQALVRCGLSLHPDSW